MLLPSFLFCFCIAVIDIVSPVATSAVTYLLLLLQSLPFFPVIVIFLSAATAIGRLSGVIP